MKTCERCECIHDGTYGSGRYCSKKCAFTKNEKQLKAARKQYSENDIVGRGNSKMTAKERWKYDSIK